MNDDRVDRTKEISEVIKQLKSNYGVGDSIKTEMRIVQGARAETWADSEELTEPWIVSEVRSETWISL
jgi:hypothetical protein